MEKLRHLAACENALNLDCLTLQALGGPNHIEALDTIEEATGKRPQWHYVYCECKGAENHDGSQGGIMRIKVHDLGEHLADRYCVILGEYIYGMSENANSPNGFNQLICDVPEDFKDEGNIQLGDLPKGTLIAIIHRLSDEVDALLPLDED